MARVDDPPRDGCTCPDNWIGGHHWSCAGNTINSEVKPTVSGGNLAMVTPGRLAELEQAEHERDELRDALLAMLEPAGDTPEEVREQALAALRNWGKV